MKTNNETWHYVFIVDGNYVHGSIETIGGEEAARRIITAKKDRRNPVYVGKLSFEAWLDEVEGDV